MNTNLWSTQVFPTLPLTALSRSGDDLSPHVADISLEEESDDKNTEKITVQLETNGPTVEAKCKPVIDADGDVVLQCSYEMPRGKHNKASKITGTFALNVPYVAIGQSVLIELVRYE